MFDKRLLSDWYRILACLAVVVGGHGSVIGVCAEAWTQRPGAFTVDRSWYMQPVVDSVDPAVLAEHGSSLSAQLFLLVPTRLSVTVGQRLVATAVILRCFFLTRLLATVLQRPLFLRRVL